MPWSPIYESLLRNMEAIVVGCRGGFRPHLRALQFGGASRLARELTSFLNSGAIHRDKVNNLKVITVKWYVLEVESQIGGL